MESSKQDGLKCRWNINKKLLPFKLHYFLLFGGISGILPYMSLIAKHIGIDATAVGIVFSITAISIFLLNPVFGLIVDYFQNLKLVLISTILVSLLSYASIIFLPPIDTAMFKFDIQISTAKEPLSNLHISYKTSCSDELLSEDICKVILNDSTICERLISSISVRNDYKNETLRHLNTSLNVVISIKSEENDKMNTTCTFYLFDLLNSIPNHNPCSILVHNSVINTYQFWTFFFIALIAKVAFSSACNLSSAATFEVLHDNVEAYGRQRLFGPIGFGLISPLIGLLSYYFVNKELNFVAGFYIMVVFILLDITMLCIIDIPKTKISSNICKDLHKIVSSAEILLFAFGTLFVGILGYLIDSFEFWFLEDVGASQFLLCLIVALENLLGEVPFFFVSGWIIKKCGAFLCLAIAFLAFTIRMCLYSILINPWLVLPIDLLSGVTFALSHSTMSSFGKTKAPAGMEATLITILGGLYSGLGNALGNVLGGVGMEHLGPRKMFATSSIISGVLCLTFLVASYMFRDQSHKKNKDLVSDVVTKNTFSTNL